MSAGSHLDHDSARALARAALAEHRPGIRFGLGCLKNSDRAQRAQVYCAASPDERLAVKVYAPAGAAKAAAQAARQMAVATALPGAAPAILFHDSARNVLAMGYADGPTLAALWPVLTPQERGAKLQAAGAWLARLHGLSLAAHPFRPRGQIAWLHRLLEDRAGGRRAFPEAALFRETVTALEAMSGALRGTPAARAVTHRDLHLSNLVATGTGLQGLDFENDRPDEPLRDLVALLVDAAALAPESVPVSDLAAALSCGYGRSGFPPATALFLQRLFALGVWAATPAEPSVRQAARYLVARQIIAAPEPLFS